MNDKLKKLYDIYVQAGLIKSVSFEQFKSANNDQIKKMYDIGRSSNLIQNTDYNTFSSAFIQTPSSRNIQQPPKKKSTVSPSASGTQKSSSGLGSAVAQAVKSSLVRPDGTYTYSGRPDAMYKKTGGSWYIDPDGKGKYYQIKEQSRINTLEKGATKSSGAAPKAGTYVGKEVTRQATEMIKEVAQIATGAEPKKSDKPTPIKTFKGLPGKESVEFKLDTSGAYPVWQVGVKSYDPNTALGQAGIKQYDPSAAISKKAGQEFIAGYQNVNDPKLIAKLNAHFKQSASTSPAENIFTGFPGKDAEYRVRDGFWEKRPNGNKEFYRVYNEGSINALNKQFGQSVKYSPGMDKFSGVAEDVELLKKKELDKNISSINSGLIAKEEDEVIKTLKSKFPNFTFIRSARSIFEGDAIEVFSPNKKDSIYIDLDNWTDDANNSEARRLRGFITSNSQEDLINSVESLKQATEANQIKEGVNVFSRRAKPGDPEYDINRPADMQPLVTQFKNVTKEEKQLAEQKEQLARKEYAKQSHLVYRDIYDKQKQAAKTGSTYDDKEIQAQIAAIPHDEELVKQSAKFTDDINKMYKDYDKKSRLLKAYAMDVQSQIQRGELSEQEYKEKYEPQIKQLNDEITSLGSELKDQTPYIQGVTKTVEEAIANEYLVNEARGSFGQALAYKFLKGITALPRLLSPDIGKKEQDDIIRFIVGDYTTEEYMNSKNRGDVGSVVLSLSESLGTLAFGFGAGTAAGAGAKAASAIETASFFAPSYLEMKDELDTLTKNGADISNFNKVMMSGAYGLLSSVLEKFGMDYALQRTGVGKTVMNNIMATTFKNVPKDASKEYIQAAMTSSVKNLLKTVPLQVLSSAAVEGTTEGLQALSKLGIQEVYDGLSGSEYFNNKSAWEIFTDLAHEAYLGALGGGIMSSVASAPQVVSVGARGVANKQQLEVLINSASLENIDQAILTNLKSSILTGKYTKEGAKQIYGSFQEIQNHVRSMPENFTPDQKSVALDLMIERSMLEKQIANKDQSLTTPQRNRIGEINVQLSKLAENAVQEQATSEVPIQPEPQVSGEVAQGVPQSEPQVTTQEGEQAVQQEEVVSATEAGLVVSDAINRPATLSSYGDQQFESPKSGDVYVEGQQVVFEERGTGQIYELGNVDQIANSQIPGLAVEQERITITPEGKVDVDGNQWNIQSELPTQGIEYNPAGEVTRVSLKDDQGNTTMFTGQDAVDIAYQIELQKIQSPEQQQFINDLLEQDEEFQAATAAIQLPEVAVAIETPTVEVPQQAQPTAAAVEPTAVAPIASTDNGILASPVSDKVVFVDVDGVLSPMGSEAQDNTLDDGYADFDRAAVDRLNRIVEETGADIVISSSWRKGDVNAMRDVFVKRGFKYPEKIVGETSPANDPFNRGGEIELWMAEFAPNSAFVALDDIPGAFSEQQRKNLVQTDMYQGITDDTVNDVVSRLGGKAKEKAAPKKAAAKKETEEKPAEPKPTKPKKVRTEEEQKKIDEEVALLEQLLGKTPPKFKKEGEEELDVSVDDVDKISKEMNELPDEKAEFDIPSNMTTKNKTNISSLIKRFGNKLKSVWNGGIIKDISTFNGIPFIFTISDQLSSGPIKNPFTGSTIDVNGGLGFNLTEGNENNAWANTSKGEAEKTLTRAIEVYNKNKSLFDRLWSEGKLPNGHIPMAVVKMGTDSIKTNEALFRLASDNIKKNFNKKERTNSLKGLIEDIGDFAVNAENNKRKKNGKPALTSKEASKIYSDAINDNKVVQFIKENNFKTIDELLDNMSRLTPIGERLTVSKFLFTGDISLDTVTKPGTPTKKSALALVGNKDASYRKYIHQQTLNNIIQEEATSKIPKNHIIAIVGVDVLNPEVTSVDNNTLNHKNYPYGMKGQLIGILENPINAIDVFPEMYSKSMYLQKPDKAGKMPSITNIVDQAVAAGGPIASTQAFRGAKLSTKIDDLKKLIGKLKLAFPSVTIVDTQQEFDEALKDPNVSKFVKDGEVVYGFTTDGKIFLNPEKANSNTAIHEFSHIWMSFLRENNPKLLEKGFSLLEGTSILKQKIKELGDNELAREEAMAELIANRGETIVEAGIKSRFKNWLNAMFTYVKSKFVAFDKLTPEQFEKLSLNQFVDGSLASMLSGEEITSKQLKSVQVLFSKQNNINQIVALARQNNISDAAIEQYLQKQGFADKDIVEAITGQQPAPNINIDEIYKRSEEALKKRYDENLFIRTYKYFNKIMFDRQEGIKRLIKNIKNPTSKRAYDLLVNKPGASGWASYRFKRLERVIYKGLDSKELKYLDKLIYARRIIDINANRRAEGKEIYTGIDDYNEANARLDLLDIKNKVGEKKYEDLNSRAEVYFSAYRSQLKDLYEAGRINEATYLKFKDNEYSPIKTIKYLIGPTTNPNEVDLEASKMGISRHDINKLSNSNKNAIIMDSRWLLMLTMHANTSRSAENKMLNAFDKAIKEATQEEKAALSKSIIENPVVGVDSKGKPKQKYTKSDFTGPNKKSELIGYTPVTFFDNGVEKILIVENKLAEQLLDIKNTKLDRVLRKVGFFTGVNILRYMATVGNPLFIIGNVPIDIANAVFLTDVYSWFKPLALLQASAGFSRKIIRSIYDDIRTIFDNEYENKEYREYVEHGGAIDIFARDGLKTLREGLLSENALRRGTAKTLNTVGATMSYLGSKSEFAMRIAVYAKQKQNLINKFKKENKREPNKEELDAIMWSAAREGRELVDFSQGGSFIKTVDTMVPYLNPATQGVRKTLKYSKENPLGFANSMVQASLMAGSFAAYSLANAYSLYSNDDDDEKNRKVKDALDSISPHEKAMYHIIFTGRVDESGNLEYIKIKKLPVVGVLTTIVEQYSYKAFFEMNGGEYNVDTKLMWNVIKKSMPLWPTEIESRNPLVSAYITYKYNRDTFTGEEVFRSPKDKKIKAEHEGINDDRVEEFFKVVAPFFGMSPKRSKAALEKIITSPNTNPMVHVLYAAMNGVFGATSFVEDIKVCGEMMVESAGKKLVKFTNPDILQFQREDRYKEMETNIESEIWLKEQSVYNKIEKIYEEGKELSTAELVEIVKDKFPERDFEKYVEKYTTFIKNRNLPKGMLDVIYERVPESQAAKMYIEFGPVIGDSESEYIRNIESASGKKISKKAWSIYQEKYQKK